MVEVELLFHDEVTVGIAKGEVMTVSRTIAR
jgi:hypothetical protein